MTRDAPAVLKSARRTGRDAKDRGWGGPAGCVQLYRYESGKTWPARPRRQSRMVSRMKSQQLRLENSIVFSPTMKKMACIDTI